MTLEIKDLHVSYGGIRALKGISLKVEDGQIVTLIGANGAGKSTTLRALSGLEKVQSGQILYDGADITGIASKEIVRRGLVMVPEGRLIFPDMTVLENLRIGAYLRRDREIAKDIEQLWENQTEMETRRQIVDQLLEKNEFEVPDTLVEQRIDQMLQNSLQRLAAQGIDPKRLPMPTQSQRDQFRPDALKAVKAGVLMTAIGRQEGITVSDEQVDEAVREKAELFEMAPDYFKERLEEAGNMEDFREGLLEDQVYKFVEANAEITEQEPPVQETSEEKTSEKE